MEKVITTSEYGYSIFSVDSMCDFMSKEKIRSKKLLALLQKDKKKYLKSLEDGSWLPIPAVDFGEVLISVEGYDEPFSNEWEEVITYDGFNITVKNGLWITDIGLFHNFDKNEFQGDGVEIPLDFGRKEYYSQKEKWYTTLDEKKIYNGFSYDVPDGKYLIKLSIYARKGVLESKEVNYGMRIGLKMVEEFLDCKNPREEEYDFKINWMLTSKKATVHWLPTKESGIKWPLKEREYKGMITTPSGEQKPAILVIIFDVKNQSEEGKTPCRVKTGIRKLENFSLESGKEYPIFEEIYKRGKNIYKELGTIMIE
ncbi:MAG: hypothetical protein MJ172_10345 [Clostridia bacterium]|nr:hypothetical protein [Clostridia bacterium]